MRITEVIRQSSVEKKRSQRHVRYLKMNSKRDLKLEKYLKVLLKNEKVKHLIKAQENYLLELSKTLDTSSNTINTEYILPHIYVSETCGAGVAGQLWYYENEPSILELSSWIIIDTNETKRVIRHEFAHDVKPFCKLYGTAHGRGFNQALKAVSNKRWRKDKHWYSNRQIDLARSLIHPKIRLKG